MALSKVVCWNSAGLRASADSTAEKMAYFDAEFPHSNFAIAAFVETHHKNEDDLPEELAYYSTTHNVYHTPTHDETHAGIIVIISKEYRVVSITEAIPGRLLNIKCKRTNNEEENNISVFYGLQWKKIKKDDIITVIEHFNNLHDINDFNLILGDFNFVELDIDKGKNMDHRDKLLSRIWNDVKSKNGLTDPYRIQYPNKISYSFNTPTGKSRGDRIYVSEDHTNSITNMKYIYSHFGSSHKIMTCDISGDQDIGKGYWKMNSSIISDEQYRILIENAMEQVGQLRIDDNLERWDLIIMLIRSISIKYSIQKKKIKDAVKTYVVREILDFEKRPRDNMTVQEKQQYRHFKERLKQINEDEIQGHLIRTKGHPRYELNEPDIDFYAKLERRSQKKNILPGLTDKNGKIHTSTQEMIKIAEEYYTQLYTPAKVDRNKQERLLKNIDKKVSDNHRAYLSAPISEEELEGSVRQLKDNTSPGADGITPEFYKKYWYLLKDHYIRYINTARYATFPLHRNTSITTLIFKQKGEIYHLMNHRPISLLNVDLKILTKTLANRLKIVLPTIIHHSQTGIPGRKIDHTIHMLRDLIDIVENEDTEAAFIFLDQEKAFDMVDHHFLYKTMEAFGIGNEFINWIKVLYCNAFTRIKINGHLTSTIPLRRGAKQGCPLSALLYVMVIEVLALQLRKNPNIVGFKVGGEKIISLHYADDATITITQNRCFKEVIKDICTYESATGAKINHNKTKGLWLGKWKNRKDKPMNIQWTDKNVKNLGVYFGTQNPAQQTFQEIIPKIKRSMDYWKQFRLSTMAKARVIEIFHASRLWYASTFYDIPLDMQKQIQKEFLNYITFPRKTNTISESEMQKLRQDGGAKLINIQSKIEASKIRWLLELVTNTELSTHVIVIEKLLGTQKGSLIGTELFFTTKQYANRILKTKSAYYQEAIKAISKLNIKKKIEDINNEKLFYNPIFKTSAELTLTPNLTCIRNNAYTYGDILREYEKMQNNEPHNKRIANVYKRITTKDVQNRSDYFFFHTEKQKYITFQQTTHKIVYQELLKLKYKEHHSKEKWEKKFSKGLDWQKIWESLNDHISNETTKSIIWEQIHLNEYTTYSYNKWHNTRQKCPFCNQIPQSEFHITTECLALEQLWTDLEIHLLRIHPVKLTAQEKVFGLQGNSDNIILRNWITFLLRQCIVEQECIAYHSKQGKANTVEIKLNLNQTIKTELWNKYNIYKHLGRLPFFIKTFSVNNYLITWENQNWQVLTLYTIP